MRGFGAFLGKEMRETVHTWRIWVLPGFILFAALSSPLITFLTPTLVDRLGGMSQGFAITVPEPTALAAYTEYLGNLGELVMIALVIAYGGIVSAEVRSGTAALALAKPLSRAAFVLAKWLSQVVVIAVALAVATGACIALTSLLLGLGPAPEAVMAAALWFVYAVLILSVMVLLSAVLPAPAAAAGAGIGAYASLAILAQFDATSRLTPAGLMPAAQAVLEGGAGLWQMPMVTGVALSAACLAAAVWRFSRREI
jgi:ABC-2 type transport system permease protein